MVTDIVCSADTAASVTHLVHSLRSATCLPSELRVLDLCTGTGCIPLLFQHEFQRTRNDVDLRILGVDISGKALNLACRNRRNIHGAVPFETKSGVHFIKADILANPFEDRIQSSPPLRLALLRHKQPAFWDILISNPPYISPEHYWKTTVRSVRGFEPKLALVPQQAGYDIRNDTQQGDLFYPQLLNIAREVEAKIVLLEIGDLDQAQRVAELAASLGVFDGIEIWRDQPGITSNTPTFTHDTALVGEGQARSVVCWRDVAAPWLGKASTLTEADDDRRLFREEEDPCPRSAPFDREIFFSKPLTGNAMPMRQSEQVGPRKFHIFNGAVVEPKDILGTSMYERADPWEPTTKKFIERNKLSIDGEQISWLWNQRTRTTVILQLLLEDGYDIEPLLDLPRSAIIRKFLAYRESKRKRIFEMQIRSERE